MAWAKGFIDRDKKFIYEFQTTFESCLWELYLHGYLKEIGAKLDFSFSSPDFVANVGQEICIEATIAAPSAQGKAAYGYAISDIPTDLNTFNAQSTLRICNSFISKERKYREKYSKLPHVQDKPFVIAIASYDRPFSHLAANRPVMSALYGLYYDEETTISQQSPTVLSYTVDSVAKTQKVAVPLGFFLDDSYKHISAVIYSSLATFGKIRALADNPNAQSIYTSFHPNEHALEPLVKITPKSDYTEHLVDGLYVLHNPFAERPLEKDTLSHPRLAQVFASGNGEIEMLAPNDFLLLRFLQTISSLPIKTENN